MYQKFSDNIDTIVTDTRAATPARLSDGSAAARAAPGSGSTSMTAMTAVRTA